MYAFAMNNSIGIYDFLGLLGPRKTYLRAAPEGHEPQPISRKTPELGFIATEALTIGAPGPVELNRHHARINANFINSALTGYGAGKLAQGAGKMGRAVSGGRWKLESGMTKVMTDPRLRYSIPRTIGGGYLNSELPPGAPPLVPTPGAVLTGGAWSLLETGYKYYNTDESWSHGLSKSNSRSQSTSNGGSCNVE